MRFLIEEGYYLEEPPTSLTFNSPAGVKVSPSRLETKGRILGEYQQTAEVTAEKPGAHRIPAEAEARWPASTAPRDCR